VSRFVIYTLRVDAQAGTDDGKGGSPMTIDVAEREALREAVRDLLRSRCTEHDVRRVMAGDDGFDRALWRQLAEQGVTGIVIDAEYGGVGLGARELEAVAEEIGAAVLPSPFISSAVLTATLVEAAGSDTDKQRLLPRLADGSAIGTVAVTGTSGTWTRDGVDVRVGAGGTLTGSAHYVTDGQVADLILVVADGPDGIGIYQVEPDAAGFSRVAATVFDPTVRLSTYTFDGAPAQRLGAAGWDAVQHALDLAVVALAGEQSGGARRIFDITVDYLKTRIQFGRPIGSFQALKHMAADLLLTVESATSAAQNAAAQKAAQLAGDVETADGAIALAGFTCAEAYRDTAAQAIQMHGGIGFTWEHPAHLYLRRARTGLQLFGGPRLHRERYLQSKGA
jgi:alkylation response protein AidB-like acyl-CoA dehydrogenase